MAYEMRCRCGSKSASFQFKDNVMSQEILRGLYCPSCSSDMSINPETMVVDNGWVIEYDMDVARFMGQKIGNAVITSDFLFDAGYCTWNGMYPGDHLESIKERECITALAKKDPTLYLKEMKSWATERIKRLQKEGWRKAYDGEPNKR
jgi:hypothetical protein